MHMHTLKNILYEMVGPDPWDVLEPILPTNYFVIKYAGWFELIYKSANYISLQLSI